MIANSDLLLGFMVVFIPRVNKVFLYIKTRLLTVCCVLSKPELTIEVEQLCG